MSTEHQEYSTQNQIEAIERYAAENDMEIVATYSDEARSGLRLENRPGIRQMLDDAKREESGFDTILVYDITRWGRFQNPDQSASIEYACQEAKVEVHYCMEQFVNDGSPVSNIIKAVKRSMAAELSRELSNKVFAGQCTLIRRGWPQAPAPGCERQARRRPDSQPGRMPPRRTVPDDRRDMPPGALAETVGEIVRRQLLPSARPGAGDAVRPWPPGGVGPFRPDASAPAPSHAGPGIAAAPRKRVSSPCAACPGPAIENCLVHIDDRSAFAARAPP